MFVQYNLNEILQFAISIEQTGHALYEALVIKFSKNKQIENLFTRLLQEETAHEDTFKAMLVSSKDYKNLESYPEEYFQYLKSFSNTLIFSAEALDKKISEIDSLEDALNFAMQREKDSISYYQELKPLVSADSQEHIDLIINEERKHYLSIEDTLKTLK